VFAEKSFGGSKSEGDGGHGGKEKGRDRGEKNWARTRVWGRAAFWGNNQKGVKRKK